MAWVGQPFFDELNAVPSEDELDPSQLDPETISSLDSDLPQIKGTLLTPRFADPRVEKKFNSDLFKSSRGTAIMAHGVWILADGLEYLRRWKATPL